MGRVPANFEPMATTDVVFRYIFSSAGSEEGLLAFINAVQQSANRPLAKEIEVQNPFNLQSFIEDKGSILDIKAVDTNSRTFDIEMQTTFQNAFANRILYYWSRLYADQIKSGDNYTRLNPVVSIVLAQFEMFPKLPGFHHVFSVISEENPEFRLTDDLQINILELTEQKLGHLPLFPRSADSPLNGWLDFLLNANQKTEDEMETLLEYTPGLQTVYGKYREFSASDELRELAFAREKYERDRRGQILTAEEKGRAEGREEGRAEGREEGRAEGREEGRSEERLNMLIQTLQFRFPECLTQETQERIRTIQDLDRLNDIFLKVLKVKEWKELEGEF